MKQMISVFHKAQIITHILLIIIYDLPKVLPNNTHVAQYDDGDEVMFNVLRCQLTY